MSKSKKGESIEELQATNEKAAELVNAGFSEATTAPKDGTSSTSAESPSSSSESTSQPQPDSSSALTQTEDSPAISEPSATSTQEASPSVPEAAELLATADDDSDRMKAVKTAAEWGWNRFGDRDDLAGGLGDASNDAPLYSDLNPLEKLGLQAMVLSIVNNPHADTIAKIMADNNDRRTVRILDNELRKALGYAEVYHA